PSPVPYANGAGVCSDVSGNTAGCDTLLTPGVATDSTLAKLTANGYYKSYDLERVAVSLYSPSGETFYTYDDPVTAGLKMWYVNARGLGGGFVWAVKDDDAKGTMVKTMANILRTP